MLTIPDHLDSMNMYLKSNGLADVGYWCIPCEDSAAFDLVFQGKHIHTFGYEETLRNVDAAYRMLDTLTATK